MSQGFCGFLFLLGGGGGCDEDCWLYGRWFSWVQIHRFSSANYNENQNIKLTKHSVPVNRLCVSDCSKFRSKSEKIEVHKIYAL